MHEARGFFGMILATALGATIWVFLSASLWPPSVLYGAGFLAGALALRMYQEVRHFGQIEEINHLRWENQILREQNEQLILNSAVARQHGGDSSQN